MELETTADSSHKKLSPATTENNELGFGPWAGLNPDLLISIFVRILPIDAMVRAVPLVCTAWRNALNRPDCWTHIDLEQWCHRHEVDTAMVDFAVRNVVQRSSGTLTTLSVFKLGNSGFFSACSSYFLRVLEMRGSDVTDQMVEKHAEALSKLTTLDISDCLKITSKGIRVLGKYCKSLVELRRNLPPPYFDDYTEVDELEAMAIADSMHSIEHLELACGRFSNQGVSAILSNCGTLRVLDIRGCCNLGDVDIRKKFDSILRGRVTLKTSAAWFVGDEDVGPSDDEGDSEDDEGDSEGDDGYDSSAGLVDVDTSDDSDDGYD